MANRSTSPINDPTVKIWLPPGVTEVALGGDWLMKRRVTLTGEPEEGRVSSRCPASIAAKIGC